MRPSPATASPSVRPSSRSVSRSSRLVPEPASSDERVRRRMVISCGLGAASQMSSWMRMSTITEGSSITKPEGLTSAETMDESS